MQERWLGRYRVTERLMQTLFGEIVLGIDPETSEKVVIKRSDPKIMVQKNLVENPIREARVHLYLSQQLGSYVIPRFLGEFYDADSWFCNVSEYLSGPDVFDMVVQQKRIQELQVRGMTRQMLYAIAFIHRHGYSHLDVSLENFRFDASGRVRLLDFGVVTYTKTIDKFPDKKPGKVRYMAPEMYQGDHCIGPAIDMFAMGVCIFIMLVGAPPFEIPNVSGMRYRMIATGRLAELLRLIGVYDVSEVAIDLMSSLMHPDPSLRCTLDQALEHPFVKLPHD
jgi:serine/threonine protein kinase